MKNACFVSLGSRDVSSQKRSLFSCLRPAQEMQQMLGLENEGRRMDMVGCVCAVSDGTGQKPPAPLSWHRPPWHGAPEGQTDAVGCLVRCLFLTPLFAEYIFKCCGVSWIRMLPEERRHRALGECFLCCEALLLLLGPVRVMVGEEVLSCLSLPLVYLLHAGTLLCSFAAKL